MALLCDREKGRHSSLAMLDCHSHWTPAAAAAEGAATALASHVGAGAGAAGVGAGVGAGIGAGVGVEVADGDRADCVAVVEEVAAVGPAVAGDGSVGREASATFGATNVKRAA